MLAAWCVAAPAAWAQQTEPAAGSALFLPSHLELTSGYVQTALGFIHKDRWLGKVPSFRLSLVREPDRARYQIGGITVQIPHSPFWLGYEYLVDSDVMGTAQWIVEW